MHIIIYGTGAIGGFYGTLLERSLREGWNQESYKVSFIARSETFDALKKQGIRLKRIKKNIDAKDELLEDVVLKNISVFPDFKSLPINPEEETAILLCVKSKDTEAAAREIQKKINERLYVISVQNGVENEKKLASFLGWPKVVGAITNIAIENIEPGFYLDKQMGKHRIVVGEFPSNSSETRLKKLALIFQDARINLEISDKIEILLWSKLVWNSAFNTLSALYKANLGQLFDEHEEELISIMQESYRLANALNIKLPENLIEEHLKRTKQKEWRDFKTSMLQDALAGKELEIEDLLGVVIRESEKLRLECPAAKKAYAALKAHIV
jgi:2-dehydropantoate 2-reductase